MEIIPSMSVEKHPYWENQDGGSAYLTIGAGAGTMAQQLRVVADFAEDLSF